MGSDKDAMDNLQRCAMGGMLTAAEFAAMQAGEHLDRWLEDIQAMLKGDDGKVHHPEHYNSHPSGVECIDVIEHLPHNVGAAVKYLWRCDHKHPNPDADLRKAAWFILREIVRRKKQRS